MEQRKQIKRSRPTLVLPSDSKNWHIFVDGRYISTRTPDKAKAQIFLQNHIATNDEREVLAREIYITVRDLIDGYSRHIEHKNPKTFKTKWGALHQRLISSLGHHDLYDLSDDEMNAYIARRYAAGVKSATVRQEVSTVNAAWKWAHKRRRTLVAAQTFDLPPNGDPRDVWLTKQEAKKMLSACKYMHEKLFIGLGFATAARHEALLDLTWDRVNLKTGIVDLRVPKHETGGIAMKNRSTVKVVDKKLLDLLAEAKEKARTEHVIEFRGARVKYLGDAFARIRKRAGIEKTATPHAMRHSAATWMAMAGRPAAKIADVLGNDEAMVKAVYRHRFPEFMKEEADSLRLDLDDEDDDE